jgi:hypothetical protein
LIKSRFKQAIVPFLVLAHLAGSSFAFGAAEIPQTSAATIHTRKGDIQIEFYPGQVPLTVANFV